MSDEDAIDRAHRAARLMDDELLNEALDLMRETYLNTWEHTPVRDVLLREKLWMMISAVRLFKQHLRSVLDGGKVVNLTMKMRNERMR